MATKTAFKKVTHCIFDLDGILLDTENIYKDVFSKMASKYGKRYTPKVQMKVMGRPIVESFTALAKELKLPTTADKLFKECKTQMEKLFLTCHLMPGAEKLVRHLHNHKIPIAVATSSHEDSYKLKITNHKEFFSLFHHNILL